MNPKVNIVLDTKRSSTHSRFRVDVNDVSFYLTYSELVVFVILAIRRKQDIRGGWIGIDEFGKAPGATRAYLCRMAKRFRGWPVYESDGAGNVRMLTTRGKIKIDLDRLSELGDHRFETMLI